MTICDKINTVGETLESNLNARGVSCTFGTGTGEKTILDMANLITANQLKGSADKIISINASKPYLEDDETTDITVTLKNGLGQPLKESVTVSDGTNTYTGITNTKGVFTLQNMGGGTYTATSYLLSDSVTVTDNAIFYDNATSQNKNTHWKVRSADTSELTVSVNSGGTSLSNSSTTTSRYYFANPSDSASDSPPITMSDFCIECDVLSTSFTQSDSQIAFMLQGQTTNFNLKNYIAPYHLKIEKVGTTAKHYVDNRLIRTTEISDRVNYYAGFQLYKTSSMTFRDYCIYPLD